MTNEDLIARVHAAIFCRAMVAKRPRSEKAAVAYAENMMVSILRCKPEEIAAAIVNGVPQTKARNISKAITAALKKS
jgi:hypothetical protein